MLLAFHVAIPAIPRKEIPAINLVVVLKDVIDRSIGLGLIDMYDNA